MEKLIELLNEYEVIRIKEANNKKEVWNLDRYTPYRYTKQVIEWFSNTIISKSFGFIQRLVENDKIDLIKLTCMNPRYTEILDSDFSWEDRIIMLLSIQDNPIEFLVSILK